MFDILIKFFQVFLYIPLFNLLVLLYNYIPGKDFGLAIILLTLIIRIALYPLSVKALNSQKTLQGIQPKVQEIQKKYKDNKEQAMKETLGLYKKEKINPLSGLFLAIVQLPILIALYTVFWKGLNPEEFKILYEFVPKPEHINPVFLGMADLSKPNLVLAFLAGILQFFQTKMLTPAFAKASASVKTSADKSAGKPKELKGPDFSNMMQKQMLYFFPAMTVVILLSLPSALGLYWTISGIFSIIQQYLALKHVKPN